MPAAATRPAKTTATWRAWRSLLAGFPKEVRGITVNRNCSSGLDAVNQAAKSITRRRGRCLHRRRRGEHEPRAVGHAQAGTRRTGRPPADLGHDHRLALQQPQAWTRCIPSSAWARRPKTSPPEMDIGRAEQDAFALESQRRDGGGASTPADSRTRSCPSHAAAQRRPERADTDEHPRYTVVDGTLCPRHQRWNNWPA